MSSYNLPAPRRITASNLPLPSSQDSNHTAEPGVEVKVDSLPVDPLLNGTLMRAVVATSKQIPTSNDGQYVPVAPMNFQSLTTPSGEIPLDTVPGMGIVLPGGLNLYYLDVAPRTEGTMHRTTSTDYLVVVSGKLSLLTPPAEAYEVREGKAGFGEAVETVCGPGDVVAQRGMMHACVLSIFFGPCLPVLRPLSLSPFLFTILFFPLFFITFTSSFFSQRRRFADNG